MEPPPQEAGTRRKAGLTADQLKAKGNQAFKDKDYDAAIDFFTRAIKLDPNNHIFFSNRSAAYVAKVRTSAVKTL